MSEILPTTTFAVSPDYRRGVALVLLAGACWSTMGLGVRFMDVANVWQILFYRSLALAPFLLLVMTLRSGAGPVVAIRRAGLAGVVGGLGLVAAFSGGIYAIQATTVANAMFLFAAAPFFAALLGRLVVAERVRRATWIAMAVAAVGIAVMVWEGISLGRADGNVAALISALGFAVFTVALRRGALSDMMPTVFLGGVFALAVSSLVSTGAGYGLVIPLNDMLIAFALGVGQVGIGLVLYTVGSKVVPAADLALLSMTEVVLGPLWVWLVLGETAGVYTLLGGVILMAAIAGNALSGARRKPPPIL
jgi:drug/metabolite transporter (DMT)-like permease